MENELKFWVEMRVRMPLKGRRGRCESKRVASSVAYLTNGS